MYVPTCLRTSKVCFAALNQSSDVLYFVRNTILEDLSLRIAMTINEINSVASLTHIIQFYIF